MVVGWFTRIVVVFAILGIVAFDAISIASTHLGAQEDANNAASDAAAAWQAGHTLPGSLATAQSAAAGGLIHGETLVPGSFRVAASGAVTLRVHRTAEHTLVAHDLGVLRHLVSFDVTGSASPPTQ